MNKLTGPIAGMVDSLMQEMKSSTAVIKPVPSMFGFKAQGTPYNCLKPKQLAAYLQVSLKTLERMRADGSGPPFKKLLNKTIRYPIATLDLWLAEMGLPPHGLPEPHHV